MRNGVNVMHIDEIQPGATRLLMRQVAPGIGTDFRVLAKMGIREQNPLVVQRIENAHISELADETISMDVVQEIQKEREGVYHVLMDSGIEYRIWIQNA